MEEVGRVEVLLDELTRREHSPNTSCLYPSWKNFTFKLNRKNFFVDCRWKKRFPPSQFGGGGEEEGVREKPGNTPHFINADHFNRVSENKMEIER